MGTLGFTDLRTRPTEGRELTRLTVHECEPLASPCEAAFRVHMALWRLDGTPRIARRYTTDKNGPVPRPEDRLLCILVSLKTSPRQVVQGRLCGRARAQRISGSTGSWWGCERRCARGGDSDPVGGRAG